MIEKYSFYPIKPEAQEKITVLREAFSACEETVLANTKPSRLLSIALTDLESAAMFAIKSIAHDPENRT